MDRVNMTENSVLDFREMNRAGDVGNSDTIQSNGCTSSEDSAIYNGLSVSDATENSISSLKSITDINQVDKPDSVNEEANETAANYSNDETAENYADNNIFKEKDILNIDRTTSNSVNSKVMDNKSIADKEIEGDGLVDKRVVENGSSTLLPDVSSNIHYTRNDNKCYNTSYESVSSRESSIKSTVPPVMSSNSQKSPGSVKSKLFEFVSAVDDICDKLSLLDDPAEDMIEGNTAKRTTVNQEISDNILCNKESNERDILTTENNKEIASHSSTDDLINNVSQLLANSDDLENDLIAELETECGSISTISLNKGLKSGGNEDIAEYELLRSRYQALEQRLKHSLDTRRQLEMDVVRLERKVQDTTISKTTAAKVADDKISELEFNLSEAKDMLVMQEEVFKQKEVDLQAEYQAKIEQIQKQLEESQREKEVAVLRFAQAEQRNLEIQDKLNRAESRLRDWMKEREVALSKWHIMKDEKKTAIELCEQRMIEITTLKKDLEAQKELVSSTDVKLKWNQNKLKSEQDALKEAQAKLDEQSRSVVMAKEEIFVVMDQLRTMYKELDVNASHHASESQNKKEVSVKSLEELLLVLKKSVGTLMWKQQELSEELRTFRDKVKCLEVERQSQESALSTFKTNLDGQRQGNSDLRERIVELEKSQQKVNELETRLLEVTGRMEELEIQNRDLLSDAERNSVNEAEHLCFTERMSQRLTSLQAENSSLHNQVSTLSEQNDEVLRRVGHLDEEKLRLENELAELRQNSSREISSLNMQLNNEQQKAALAECKMNEAQNEAKVLKRKCASIQKDMAKQLAQVARRQDGKLSTDVQSLGSRGSCGSLDTVGLTVTCSREMSPQEEYVMIERQNHDVSSGSVTSQHDACLEQIAQLQKTVSRNKDKISFLQEHTEQLTEEINRKSKIIREYVLREEAGSLSSESSDNAKAQLSRKGGVMASVYSSHNRGGGMTLELSLEINKKLQALLEDTLLKNFKLKEGMDTLGSEIEWLSRENKQLLQQVTVNQNNQHSDDTSSQDS